MSVVTPSEARAFLRVAHDFDDALLQVLIAGAEAEACRFCNRTQLPTLPQDYPPVIDANGILLPEVVATTASLAPDARIAVYYLVQAKYEGAKPEDIAKMRMAAETILQPYRVTLGV